MSHIPKNLEKIELTDASVDFFKEEVNNTIYYYFDTSLCPVPEPMINAMVGLELILETKNKLVMINHQLPMGLFPRIDKNFDFEIFELEDGNKKIIFSYKLNTKLETDFTQKSCAGK